MIGVYETAAEGSTLLGAKSLQRTASGAPLQKDVAAQAARFLRNLYIKQLQTSQAPQRAIAAATVVP